MTDPKERCSECGHRTDFGKEKDQERSKKLPIFGTDFTKPLSQLVEGMRDRLCAARGTINDIQFVHDAWGERLQDVEGLINCGLTRLYEIKQEMIKCEEKKREQTSS
jgi:hypothetical protein